MLPHLGFFNIWILECELKFSSLQTKCLLTELSWSPHSTAFASVENQVKIIAEILSPPQLPAQIYAHTLDCVPMLQTIKIIPVLYSWTHRDWKLNWDPASIWFYCFFLSSCQFSKYQNPHSDLLTRHKSVPSFPSLVRLLPFTSGLEHIYLEQIKLS